MSTENNRKTLKHLNLNKLFFDLVCKSTTTTTTTTKNCQIWQKHTTELLGTVEINAKRKRETKKPSEMFCINNHVDVDDDDDSDNDDEKEKKMSPFIRLTENNTMMMMMMMTTETIRIHSTKLGSI